MTFKQRLMTLFYPLIKKLVPGKNGLTGKLENIEAAIPSMPFYGLTATKTDGTLFSFNELKGKKVIIVNTATDCGFTPQYKELEQLYKTMKQDVAILAFPSNDFRGQEPGSDEEIAKFCKVNYGVSFPLFKKDSVLNPEFQGVYNWLADKNKNGWNELAPTWNFCKYLIDENGNLEAVYGPQISPLDMRL